MSDSIDYDFEIIDSDEFSQEEIKQNILMKDVLNVENMTMVVEHVFIGNIRSAYETSELLDKDIKFIVHVVDEQISQELISWLDKNKIYRHQISITDTPTTDISKHWDDIYHVIHGSFCMKKNILVHCHAGRSRSSTAVIYWLMRAMFESQAYKEISKNGKILDTLINRIRANRPLICPNPGFMRQLQDAEQKFRDIYVLDN